MWVIFTLLGHGFSTYGVAATAPVTTFTGVRLLTQHNTIRVLTGRSNRITFIVKQLVRPSFPYTFPVDFTLLEAGRTYGAGRVRLLN